jgi:hypothetical protein
MSFITYIENKDVAQEKKDVTQEVSNSLPQHPMLQWHGQESVLAPDHLEGYTEIRPFEESEGFLDRFRGVKTLRKKFIELCKKLKVKPPANVDTMKKKEILAELKKLKKKYAKSGTSGSSSDIWKSLSDLTTLFQ